MISTINKPHGAFKCRSSTLVVFYRFWPVSWTITHIFGVPKRFPWINEPWGAFTCRSSTLAVLADSDPYLGLLLTILGTKAISIVVEPQGALTCRSSILTVLADSGLLLGL